MTQKKSINVFTLTMINIATIMSIRNWTSAAEYGLSAIFYIILGAAIFFLPLALASAELATGWPQKGGIYNWVKAALGEKWAFLAVWLFWVENVAWYPTILAFIAATFSFVIDQNVTNNSLYTFLVSVGVFWLITFLNLLGMKVSSLLSTILVLTGTIFPGLIIIILGISWYAGGLPTQIVFDASSIFPSFRSMNQLLFLSLIILSFCGIEMSAVHANDVEYPQKSYPKAIFIAASIIIVATILGTLSICIVIPVSKISLVSGTIDSLAIFLHQYGYSSLVPIFSVFIALGALGGVSTWTAGPSRGLVEAAQRGDLPPLFQKTNTKNMPSTFMILQAVIVTILSSLYLFMPTLNVSFIALSILTANLYLLMYILLFVSFITLRYKSPATPRAYKVPGKKFGAWVITLLGLTSCIFVFCIGFIAAPDILLKDLLAYRMSIGLGVIIFCLIPLIIWTFRSKKWIISIQKEPKTKGEINECRKNVSKH